RTLASSRLHLYGASGIRYAENGENHILAGKQVAKFLALTDASGRRRLAGINTALATLQAGFTDRAALLGRRTCSLDDAESRSSSNRSHQEVAPAQWPLLLGIILTIFIFSHDVS